MPWDSAAVFVREVSCLTISSTTFPTTNKMLPMFKEAPVSVMKARLDASHHLLVTGNSGSNSGSKPKPKPGQAAANTIMEVMSTTVSFILCDI